MTSNIKQQSNNDLIRFETKLRSILQTSHKKRIDTESKMQ